MQLSAVADYVTIVGFLFTLSGLGLSYYLLENKITNVDAGSKNYYINSDLRDADMSDDIDLGDMSQ